MLNNHGRTCFWVVMLLLLATACKPKEEPNLLLGKWKVFYIDRGGMIIGGRGFKGTEYTFRDNGTVFAQATSNNNQDTLTSKYEKRGDTLVYISLVTQAEEAYRIDSLTDARMVLFANIDGIPTQVRMLKLKK
jgi:hypothetical protein